jgi:hypothetical protein
MLGKIVEIYSEFVNVSLSDKDIRIRIGDWVEFPSSSVFGIIYVIEKNFCQVKVNNSLEKLKNGDDAQLDSTINNVNINLFGNIWGESNSNLNLLDINFGTKNLELTGNSKYDFIPVVRIGESVTKSQKLGYFELAKNLKYWMLAPNYETIYEVKKINAGSFGIDNTVIILDKEGKKYELGPSQQFYYEGKVAPILIEDCDIRMDNDFEKYDFVILISEFLDEKVDSANIKFVTFLVSHTDNWQIILHKAYNIGLFLAYCGQKVLFMNNLEYKVTGEIKLEFGKTVNFEGEEGFLDSLNSNL